jgi:hypothetical protein
MAISTHEFSPNMRLTKCSAWESHLNGAAPQFLEPEDLFTLASLNARNTGPTGAGHFSIDRGLH